MDVHRIRRAKNKFYDIIEDNFEYDNTLKRIRKDNKKMNYGKLRQKYSKQIIQEALKLEVVNG